MVQMNLGAEIESISVGPLAFAFQICILFQVISIGLACGLSSSHK